MLCVENAQKIVDLVAEDWTPNGPPGVLPWWYRVFYLWLATMHVIAAMLRPDSFETIVAGHWDKAMSLLSAHEHLSQFLPQSISSFRSMWEKLAEIRNSPNDHVPPADAFQDVFQHMGLDPADLMYNFSAEDMNWLGNFDWDVPEPGP